MEHETGPLFKVSHLQQIFSAVEVMELAFIYGDPEQSNDRDNIAENVAYFAKNFQPADLDAVLYWKAKIVFKSGVDDLMYDFLWPNVPRQFVKQFIAESEADAQTKPLNAGQIEFLNRLKRLEVGDEESIPLKSVLEIVLEEEPKKTNDSFDKVEFYLNPDLNANIKDGIPIPSQIVVLSSHFTDNLEDHDADTEISEERFEMPCPSWMRRDLLQIMIAYLLPATVEGGGEVDIEVLNALTPVDILHLIEIFDFWDFSL